MNQKRKTAEGFLLRTIEIGKRRPGRVHACLIWPFKKDSDGYATITGQKSRLVSRVVCEGVRGPPPDGKPWALHDCDNGAGGCVEPTHLDWGSPTKNNVDDRLRAGTFRSGEQAPSAKLTWDDVSVIKKAHAIGLTQTRLARAYEVSVPTIGDIVNGITWRNREYTKSDTAQKQAA